MAERKITKKDKFNMLLEIPEVQANPLLREFVEKELALLAKKNGSSSDKPTEKQLENERLKVAIIRDMAENQLYTVTELTKLVPELVELSNQKVSALVRQLKDDGLVVRVEEKRRSYFKRA